MAGSAGLGDKASCLSTCAGRGRALLLDGLSERQQLGHVEDVPALALTLGSSCFWKLSCFSPRLLGFSLHMWEEVERRWSDLV